MLITTGAKWIAPLKKYSDLAKEYGGKLLGFVAFDPFRPQDEALEIVKDAIGLGYCGVKFYPSLGYQPTNDVNKKVRDTIKALFRYCCEKQIPILTHCQRGPWMAYKGSDKKADPLLWEEVLLQGDFTDLSLCLAHAGGGIYEYEDKQTKQTKREYGWFCKDETEWEAQNIHYAKTVVRLCSIARFPNLYCDLSIMREVLIPVADLGPLEARNRLAKSLERFLTKQETELPKRIMYGSDWHMPDMLGYSRNYLRILIEIFNSDVLKPFADDFFFKNAVRFLRLREYVERNKEILSDAAQRHLLELASLGGVKK